MKQIIEDELLDLAGQRVFQRGSEYFTWGQVVGFSAAPGAAQAHVLGAHAYRVRLWRKAGQLSFSCECPVGQTNRFCKHAVALGLYWRAGQSARTPLTSARAWLRWLEYALNCWSLGEVAQLEQWWDERLSQQLDELLATGSTAQTLVTVEAALSLMVARGPRQAAGELAAMRQRILTRLWQVHLGICRQAGMSPAQTVERLLAWQLQQLGAEVAPQIQEPEWWEWDDGLAQQMERCGVAWQAEYLRQCEARLLELTRLDEKRLSPAQRRRLVWLSRQLEAQARRPGRLDRLLELRQWQSVSSKSAAARELELAQLFQQAGRVEEALELAERSLNELRTVESATWRAWRVALCVRSGQPERVLRWLWNEFAARPTLTSYRQLKQQALACAQWPDWQARVWEHLQRQSNQATVSARRRLATDQVAADHSEQVRTWLAEGSVEQAWRVALAGGCADEFWLKLAALRTRAFPAEALTVYQAQTERLLAHKDRYSARRARRLLRRVRRLMRVLSGETAFADYLRGLQQAHGAQRNFAIACLGL